ncbi:MAG: MBL fold metallo-hydrolase [Planctomycetota bacterium]
MQIKQYYLGCLAHASYLIVDEASATAAVVDPQRDVEQYLSDAEAQGVRIAHVILTHFHADFVAGHLELQAATKATIHLGARAQADYAFEAFRDGETLRMGQTRLVCMETPGHTPEGISVLVYDDAQDGAQPHAVLTGDTLFIGDVGRPDLLASIGVSADELATMLYSSLHDKLMRLPDATLVYPAHGAGSACGKNLSTERVCTIGKQRRTNYALQPMTEAEFKQLVTAGQPDAPRYFLHDAVLNRKQRDVLDDTLKRELRPLTIGEVFEWTENGAQLLDTREQEDFAHGHLRGSTNVPLDGKYANWAGSVLDLERPVILIATPGTEHEAALRLGRIGIDDVLGYLDGGIASAGAVGGDVVHTERIRPDELEHRLWKPEAPHVLDVRTCGEWAEGHIEGAWHIPLAQLEQRIAEVPADRALVVICRSGYRSSIAASMLRRMLPTLPAVVDLAGGMDAWNAAGKPVLVPAEAR